MPCLSPVMILNHEYDCGHCSECCKKYSDNWTQRILDEFNLCGRVGCFCTLTYDDQHLPDDLQVRKRDCQLFMKRLRKAIAPAKVRFFSCGEYGGKRNRPHYHFLFFGWRPDDMRPYGPDPDKLTSPFLARVWKNGFVLVGDITEDSAKYCTKYMAKADFRWHNVRPFTNMSRRPGIGFGCVTPEMLLTGQRYINGRKYFLPRAYFDQLEKRGFDTKGIRRLRSLYLEDGSKMNDQQFRDYKRYHEELLNAFK